MEPRTPGNPWPTTDGRPAAPPPESAEQARGAWATPPAAGTYGRAAAPMNAAAPANAAAAAAESHTERLPRGSAQVAAGGPAAQVAAGGPAAQVAAGGPGVEAGTAEPGWVARDWSGSGGGGERNPAGQPAAGATARTNDGDRPVEAGPVNSSRTGKGRKIYALLAVVVVVVVGVATLGLVQPGRVKGWLGSEVLGTPTKATLGPDPAPSPVLAPVVGGGRAPDAAKVKAALDPLVRAKALGSTVSVSVVDVASGQALYDRNADVPATPASTTKLLTAATVLASRGPGYRLSTTAVAGSVPGEVVLVGGGDPTLSVGARGLYPGAARLDQLAAQVKTALGGTRPTRVLVDTSLFGGPQTGLGWSPGDVSPDGQVAKVQSLMTNGGRVKPVHNEHGGDPRFADPAISAGQAFAKLLGVSAATVKRGKAPSALAATGVAPGARLGEVKSPPLVQITDWMLEQSDNILAEVLARQVAIAAGRPATFDGETDAMIAKLRALGLAGDEADLYDGSGLSRHNGISPLLLTQVLALAANGKQPAITGIFGGLPVAGWSGTLQGRFDSPTVNRAAYGVVRAKTGTLSGVNTMAGELVTRDGRLLVFAIMASGSSNAYAAKDALDRVPARLVACGC
ncbi:D-alanyl-D-alanine carboxypeptidase/D-alanyl-D-alanine-endopeptidase [Actinoplanes sp. KI2]|uniref:D-alanyl-D-alanine carboxypeptidase/D-alanyl-D-alanine endopeptidase n=1 Tax=Actinoplanes sp. KI2 TaxID=2983315 RepID=UPI0021D5B6DE|nr:D-alanyl-D-alanine carboxypeptidase/D-alanyl-D-alanine-endopeptidase [Actinoplanes sp. KI2]MCU7722369.1 D-alanyl-D-alanine carboxypeptidase/D-alanyl-D-alanine-endopeptidase [Actinoplanes sp. KI2]